MNLAQVALELAIALAEQRTLTAQLSNSAQEAATEARRQRDASYAGAKLLRENLFEALDVLYTQLHAINDASDGDDETTDGLLEAAFAQVATARRLLHE